MMMEAYTEYPGMEYKIYWENQGEGLGSKGSERKYFLCLCYHSLLPAPLYIIWHKDRCLS